MHTPSVVASRERAAWEAVQATLAGHAQQRHVGLSALASMTASGARAAT
jgi:hypothetical protein